MRGRGVAADAAAAIRNRTGVSVADAHLGAVIQAAPPGDDVTVVTSGPGDMRRMAGGRQITLAVL